MDLNFIDADKLEAGWTYLVHFAINQGMNCLAAILILIAGWWLSGRVAGAMRRALSGTHVDATMRPLLANALQWMVRVLTIVLVLSQLRADRQHHRHAGRRGPCHRAGAAGHAAEHCRGHHAGAAAAVSRGAVHRCAGRGRHRARDRPLHERADHLRRRLPARAQRQAVGQRDHQLQRERHAPRRYRGHGDLRQRPAARGLEALREMLVREPRLLEEPVPETMVINYTQQGITLNVRYWTSNDDYWNVRFAFYERIKQVLEGAGCKLAVPIQELHVPGASAVPGAVKVSEGAPAPSAPRPAGGQRQPAHNLG
ncbi:hypothetical protein N234_34340 [Ralstonia pickettii DTP0602]|nr:hypothetical protein N234_34340 [Ralstonia pickettii DTP0602]